MNSGRKKHIALILIGLLAGCILGYGYGFQSGARTAMLWGVSIAHNFMSIDFDEKEIAAMLWNYRNQVNMCYDDQKEISVSEEQG